MQHVLLGVTYDVGSNGAWHKSKVFPKVFPLSADNRDRPYGNGVDIEVRPMHVGRSLTTKERPVGVRVRVCTKPWDAGQSLRPSSGPAGLSEVLGASSRGSGLWPQSLQRRETKAAAGRRCEGGRVLLIWGGQAIGSEAPAGLYRPCWREIMWPRGGWSGGASHGMSFAG